MRKFSMQSDLAVLALVRVVTAIALGTFLYRALPQFVERPNVTLAFVLIGEIITLAIYLSSRVATASRMDPLALLATAGGTFYLFLITPVEGAALAPVWVTAPLQVCAIAWQIAAKLSLGRSFGLLPANKGVVTSGLYRLVRHPIYFGYLVGHVGFLLGSFHWSNLAIFTCLYLFQWLRVLQEEQVLRADPAYVAYTRTVRHRFIPGLL